MGSTERSKGKMATLVAALVVTVAAGSGCSIRTTAPIKEVAYDFSDRDFYDRAYAPSPKYAETYVEYGEPIRKVVVAQPSGEDPTALPTAPSPANSGVEVTAPAADEQTATPPSRPQQLFRKPVIRVHRTR